MTTTNRNAPRELDLTAQMNDLEISAYDADGISSMAPDSTLNNPYRQSQPVLPSASSRMSRPSFMNFGQSGKKSPLGRAAINRMTSNLITAQKNYVNRRST